MTNRAIVKMGNKQLATPSLTVDDVYSVEIPPLIEDMLDTMKAKQGVGIAAPQIGCNKRIIMFGFEKMNVILMNSPFLLQF
ncbi:peptide deformylase [Legionella tunisiensis]|uniref:peptide deformylase n=1 Tax=Legionella tunisiensis TaxID=1034944 RepID=UPI0002E4520D|nr:peptide deformylase [Legionella tunisiensis]